MTTARADLWLRGYTKASNDLASLPGPMLSILVPRMLRSTPDPDDDPAYDGGYRTALADALAHMRRSA
ncbi:hypothetical protein RND64_08855 [Gordonia sp. w5E2]|uniref:Uncharacterized protein n=1 Tax=Gordonia jacobaea TaxID=122202 RepID=A0ABR5IGR8_9ACTN|nr:MULTISPECIES: hypothetical protein [Gordonia]KNA92925.1 hypothetical protein ABW18_00110 [Gordonia jacobaea]